MRKNLYQEHIGNPVRITWVDATDLGDKAWMPIGELIEAKLPICETVAFLIHVSEQALHLASSRFADDDLVGLPCLIPLGWVQTIEPLTV